VVGVVLEDVTLPFLNSVLGKNVTLRGGTVNPQRYYIQLLALIRAGRLDPTEIITHRLPLADGVRGYEIFDAHEEDVLKVVLEP
jgi:S-(hydroxymethyl)glutathione dehydrogenase/alcohol dehydrogenase